MLIRSRGRSSGKVFVNIALLLLPNTVFAQPGPPTPALSDLKTVPAKNLAAGALFTFRINGKNFVPNATEVFFTGPACTPCAVPSALLTVTSDAIVGSANVPQSGIYQVSVRVNGIASATSIPLPAFDPPSAAAAGISGSSSAPMTFNVDQDFCSNRAGAYESVYSGATKTSTVTALDGPVLLGGVTDPISDLDRIIDSGASILSTTAETTLQPSGNDASRLITRTFGVGPCNRGGPRTNTISFHVLESVYYVINIVRWSPVTTPPQPTGTQAPYQIASNDWYLFNTQDGSVQKQTPFHGKFSPRLTNGTRLYGTASVGFLAVHLMGDIPVSNFKQLQIKYNVTVKQTTPVNVQHLVSLIGILTGVNLGGAAAPAAPAAPPPVVGLYGGGQLSNIGQLPDDIAFTATISFPPNQATPNVPSGQPAPITFNNTYHDEGLSHWDVSIGVPVTSITALTYSNTNGAVTTTNISQYNAYGFFDIYPWAVDISNPPAFSYPHLIAGLPFAGKVFDKPFFGAGGVVGFQSLPWIGKALNQTIPLRVSFYGGIVYNKQSRAAAVTNERETYRALKGQYGIEFSLKDVASKLTGKSKTNTKATQ